MTIQNILEVFEHCGMRWEVLDIGDGWQIVVTEHGGHVFGPFCDTYPEGVFWIPEFIRNENAYKQLITERNWNTGGDRIWIAPEIQFNIKNRSRFRETLEQPKSMDPGFFAMHRKGNQIHLEQNLDMESYNTVTGTMHLDFHRVIQKAENPLRKLSDADALMEGLSYCGYEQVLDLKASSEQDIYAESWDLLQIRPRGTLFIPMYRPTRGTDHYEPTGDHEYCVENGVCLKITGDCRYKIAYKAASLTGRFGYLADSQTEDSYLIIINYPNNPSALYSEEPPLIEGDTGYSIHIYNDDGNSGGFAEMECNMQTIGKPTGIDHAIERVTKWIFTGPRKKLMAVAGVLLGYKG